jgi:hypothetical protein
MFSPFTTKNGILLREPEQEFLPFLDFSFGVEKQRLANLMNDQILLHDVLGGTDKHQPVTSFFIRSGYIVTAILLYNLQYKTKFIIRSG